MMKREITYFAMALTSLLQQKGWKPADISRKTKLSPPHLSNLFSGGKASVYFVNQCLQAFSDKHEKDLLRQAYLRDKSLEIDEEEDSRVLVVINREGEEETEEQREVQDLVRLFKTLPREKKRLLSRVLSEYAPDDDDVFWSMLGLYDQKAQREGKDQV